MPVKEESFRIGCGRYIQGAGYTERVGDEVLRLGTSPLIVGGKTALEITKSKIEKSVSEKCNKYEIIEHRGTCNEERAKELAALAKEKGYNVIVGVGGGVLCDFAKLCGYFGELPVINVPTSSATCAAYTPLSVRYTPDGKTVGSLHFSYEVNAVVADTAVLAAQPVRLLLAGVFDALAKFVEIKQRFNEETKHFPIGLDYAYEMAKYSHKLLTEKTRKCIDAMERGEITEDVEQVIFTSLAATGVISGIARGSNQTALAHKFYEATRYFFPGETKPYLHGEIVGVGLLMQNHFNGEKEKNEALLQLMKKYHMPHCLEDIGVMKTDDLFQKYYDKLCASSAIESENEAKRLVGTLTYLWEMER
ncbi:MAG: iron-containing alcohol dehydrogenase [Clostridia bacterium]|nr:iron-containing alcohol dehydrogenase [Clostridia bacterium]